MGAGVDLVDAGVEAAAGCGADGGGGEAVIEADAFGSDTVEIRRADEVLAVAAELLAHIFADDPDDIGRGGSGGAERLRGYESGRGGSRQEISSVHRLAAYQAVESVLLA